jgi:predicted ATP-grasp superfamily ATP-dependent carboligase
LGKDDPIRMHYEPDISSSSLIVGWGEDAANVGEQVADFLRQKLGGKAFAEIEPPGFFPLDGVAVEDNVAGFPQSTFYSCQKGLVVLKSDPPRSNWYKFLNALMDVAERCHAKEVYIVGGMISAIPHTTPRRLLAIANTPEMKEVLDQHGLASDMDFQTSQGQLPTISSYLLWVAKRRNIPAASIWVPIPFYLVSNEDPRARRVLAEIFDERFELGIDFGELDEETARQNRKIAEIRSHSAEIDSYILKLETNLSLNQEESQKLVNAIQEGLRKRSA